MKTAVITVCIGKKYEDLSRLTHPTLKAYADRIGADFIVIDKRMFPDTVPIGYEKLQFQNYLDTYDRMIQMDTDLIVRSDTPSLFNVVPYGEFAAFNEGEWIPLRLREFQEGIKAFGLSAPNFDKQYYNTGVMVFDRTHRHLFDQPHEFISHYYEQTWLNIQLARYGFKIKGLGCQFNRMTHMDMHLKDHRLEAYVVHYAGAPSEELLPIVTEDLMQWHKMKRNGYHIKKTIKVSVGGGLGDQICAEPIVREIRRLYPKDRIVVASHWPELFTDLPYEVDVVDIRKHFLPDLYTVFHTYSPPEDEAWKYMTHVFSHSTDFSSQIALRRILPPEKKTIMLRYTPKQRLSMMAKLRLMDGDLKGAICLHPGRTWRTKTMPSEFWESIIEGLLCLDRPIVLFGKDGKDLQGLVPVKISSTKIIDARDRLDLKESLALIDQSDIMVSNDSAPIHLAGATDVWIVGIFTAKHTSFVVPFRHGRQDYKTLELNLRPSCWPCSVDAITTTPTEVRADYCINYDDQLCCFPTSDMVIDAIKSIDSGDIRQ